MHKHLRKTECGNFYYVFRRLRDENRICCSLVFFSLLEIIQNRKVNIAICSQCRKPNTLKMEEKSIQF